MCIRDRDSHATAGSCGQRGGDRSLYLYFIGAGPSRRFRGADHTRTGRGCPNQPIWSLKTCRRTGDTRGGCAFYDLSAGRHLWPQSERKHADVSPTRAIVLAAPGRELHESAVVAWSGNLISAIIFALNNPATIGETYLVADSKAMTIGEILTMLRLSLIHI